jgi:hypothetical protein
MRAKVQASDISENSAYWVSVLGTCDLYRLLQPDGAIVTKIG